MIIKARFDVIAHSRRCICEGANRGTVSTDNGLQRLNLTVHVRVGAANIGTVNTDIFIERLKLPFYVRVECILTRLERLNYNAH